MESFLCSGCHQPNTMVLRILVLLLLCPSLGMGATLGFYQTQAGEGGPKAGNTIMDTSSLESPEQETMVEKPLDKEHAAKSETAESRAAEDFIVETLDGNEIVVKMPAVDSLKEDTAMAQDPMAATETMMGLLPPASNIREVTQGETGMSVEYSRWSSLRGSVEAISGFFDTLVELVGGHNGVCQYRCQYGVPPQPRPGYQVAQPNGCSSSLVGLQLDLGIPAMRECCNQLDLCYDTCGESKSHCDSIFRRCLHSICFDLKKTLGFVSQVHACESMADGLYSTVGTLGCRPYMNSQRAACICEGEDRDEL